MNASNVVNTMNTPNDLTNQLPDLYESLIGVQMFRKKTVGSKNRSRVNSLARFKWLSYPSVAKSTKVILVPNFEMTYNNVIDQNSA
jgi:hypothetical protein